MIKYLTAALVLLTITTSQAQNNSRADTTLLGIYNTGARFTLTQADFGQQSATDILADMVMAYDTVEVATTTTDTSGRRTRYGTQKKCNNISELVLNREAYKDKIVLMEYNKDCDYTQTCFLAQKAGAKAFVFIHNSNSNGNIHLSKKGAFKDSITMPVFIVGKEKGADISALLPSKAGIKTKTPPPNQSAIANNNDQTNAAMLLEKQAATSESSSTKSDQTARDADLINGNGFGKQSFSISPNPTRNQANVRYQFQNPTDVTIEAKNANGQVIFSRLLRGATVGNVEIPTVDYPNGTYFVTLQYGKEVKTKKLVVRH